MKAVVGKCTRCLKSIRFVGDIEEKGLAQSKGSRYKNE